MKTIDIMNLNCEDKENLKKIRNILVKIPALSGYEPNELTVEHLEKFIMKISKKYPIMLSYITRTPLSELGYYSFMIKRADTHEWLTTAFAISMFEGFAKTTIFMYSYIKNKLQDG